METTLLFKTMVILSGQIGIVFGIAYFLIKRAKYAYENNTKLFGYSFRGAMNMNKELDLVPFIESPSNYPVDMTKTIKKNYVEHVDTKKAPDKEQALELLRNGYTYEKKDNLFAIMIFWCITLFGTLYLASSELSLSAGLSLFTIQSVAFGILLGFIMLIMDENDGIKALKIVMLVTLLTGYIGYSDFYSFSENIGLQYFLLFSLLGLIILSFIRTAVSFSRKATRWQAIFGAVIFSIYLLVDFNLIKKKEGIIGMNNWQTAFDMAFTLYLDIMNLLLEILDAMGNS
jgi:FtsH-binding integral membrane protein